MKNLKKKIIEGLKDKGLLPRTEEEILKKAKLAAEKARKKMFIHPDDAKVLKYFTPDPPIGKWHTVFPPKDCPDRNVVTYAVLRNNFILRLEMDKRGVYRGRHWLSIHTYRVEGKTLIVNEREYFKQPFEGHFTQDYNRIVDEIIPAIYKRIQDFLPEEKEKREQYFIGL